MYLTRPHVACNLLGKALAKWARRDLNARREEVLWVARRDRADLAESLQIVGLDLVPEKVQRSVLHCTRVPAGEHDAVTVDPVGLPRAKPCKVCPQEEDGRGEAEGGAEVSCTRGVDHVQRKNSYCVNRLMHMIIDVGTTAGRRLSRRLGALAIGLVDSFGVLLSSYLELLEMLRGLDIVV